MKKIYMLILSYLVMIVLFFTVDVKAADYAETDSQSFVEIMLSSGKLLKNFTLKEFDELLPKTDGDNCLSRMSLNPSSLVPSNPGQKKSIPSDILFAI